MSYVRGFAAPAMLLLLAASCSRGDVGRNLTLTPSEAMPTVATVEWDVTTEDATGAFVEFGEQQRFDRMARAWVDDGGHARAVLVGMKPETAYQYRVAEVRHGERKLGKTGDVTTGPLLLAPTTVNLEVNDPARASGGYIVTSLFANRSVALILDPDGQIVWAHRAEADWEPVHVTRTVASRLGEWVVYDVSGHSPQDADDLVRDRAIVRVALDGSETRTYSFPDTHHDFFERVDGSFATLKRERRTIDGAILDADLLVEVSPAGTERQVWSSWDHYEFDGSSYHGDDHSFTHCNAVDFDREEQAYYVSVRNQDCIVKIDRESGAVVWQLGGARSDFALPDGSTDLFYHQHEFEVPDTGIIVFDNGRPEEEGSRVVRYDLDVDTGAAELVWEHRPDPPAHCSTHGDVRLLPSGNVLITWSRLGRIEEVTEEGEVVWRLQAADGRRFGYATWRRTLADTFHAELPFESMDAAEGAARR